MLVHHDKSHVNFVFHPEHLNWNFNDVFLVDKHKILMNSVKWHLFNPDRQSDENIRSNWPFSSKYIPSDTSNNKPRVSHHLSSIGIRECVIQEIFYTAENTFAFSRSPHCETDERNERSFGLAMCMCLAFFYYFSCGSIRFFLVPANASFSAINNFVLAPIPSAVSVSVFLFLCTNGLFTNSCV